MCVANTFRTYDAIQNTEESWFARWSSWTIQTTTSTFDRWENKDDWIEIENLEGKDPRGSIFKPALIQRLDDWYYRMVVVSVRQSLAHT